MEFVELLYKSTITLEVVLWWSVTASQHDVECDVAERSPVEDRSGFSCESLSPRRTASVISAPVGLALGSIWKWSGERGSVPHDVMRPLLGLALHKMRPDREGNSVFTADWRRFLCLWRTLVCCLDAGCISHNHLAVGTPAVCRESTLCVMSVNMSDQWSCRVLCVTSADLKHNDTINTTSANCTCLPPKGSRCSQL